MFSISYEKIDPLKLKNEMLNKSAGAFVCFEGWVRDHNEGKEVIALDYEIYEELAIKEGLKIIEEAKEKFKIFDISSVHYAGSLKLGDIAVWVGVNSKHRKEAFLACEYLINEIKVRLPIWKKEYYLDGNSGWINCENCSKHLH